MQQQNTWGFPPSRVTCALPITCLYKHGVEGEQLHANCPRFRKSCPPASVLGASSLTVGMVRSSFSLQISMCFTLPVHSRFCNGTKTRGNKQHGFRAHPSGSTALMSMPLQLWTCNHDNFKIQLLYSVWCYWSFLKHEKIWWFIFFML